jgi:CheY-like chemotaxis protein
MSAIEYVCIFVRASGDRLQAAERLTLTLPALLGPALAECSFRYQSQAKLLAINVRVDAEELSQARRDRLVFWTARAGGRAMALPDVPAEARGKLEASLRTPSHALEGVPAAALFDASARFFTDAGAMAGRRRSATEQPRLVMDVGGPGWDGVRWSAKEGRLFVAAPFAPPAGDEVALLVRIPGAERPVAVRATVALVRSAAEAGPGAPAGYALQLVAAPPGLLETLGRTTVGAEADASRSAPRFQVIAPVKIVTPPAEPEAPAPAATAPQARIEYATDQELAADFIENLSQGGAFVRTPSPSPVGSALELALTLPNGAELRTRAVVAFVRDGGMGVSFRLDPEAEAVLANAIAHISARPRRALVVDDDELQCRMLADALRDRGFEVLTAGDATEGLSTLAEELLALDLLVTDVVMPGMGGEELVRLIRKTGGEVDLAIVCATGQLGEEGIERRLEAAGADAVLDKALGPDLIAQASDAVLERKRMVAQQA